MKRIYRKRTRSAIQKQAMEQVRETRKIFDERYPQLLPEIRRIVEVQASSCDVSDTRADRSVSIDRKKNLETVLKYIELKPDSNKIMKDLKKILH